jgi:hypothetical protein
MLPAAPEKTDAQASRDRRLQTNQGGGRSRGRAGGAQQQAHRMQQQQDAELAQEKPWKNRAKTTSRKLDTER